MIKSSIIALVTVAAMGSLAAPAFADAQASNDTANDSLNTGSYLARESVADTILVRLQSQGVKATDVEAWGGLVRAYVTQADGTVAMQYFAADSLKPAAL